VGVLVRKFLEFGCKFWHSCFRTSTGLRFFRCESFRSALCGDAHGRDCIVLGRQKPVVILVGWFVVASVVDPLRPLRCASLERVATDVDGRCIMVFGDGRNVSSAFAGTFDLGRFADRIALRRVVLASRSEE